MKTRTISVFFHPPNYYGYFTNFVKSKLECNPALLTFLLPSHGKRL